MCLPRWPYEHEKFLVFRNLTTRVVSFLLLRLFRVEIRWEIERWKCGIRLTTSFVPSRVPLSVGFQSFFDPIERRRMAGKRQIYNPSKT